MTGLAHEDTADGKAAEDGRVLCVDPGCIGLVGYDGHCKVCGLAGPLPGAAAAGDACDPEDESDARHESDEHDAAAAADAKPAAADEELADADATDAEFASRQLCPDESCIGVLGADGRCQVCGCSVV